MAKEEGGFPTVRHERLLGLIGRSQCPAKAQAEEQEAIRRLDWDRVNTIFTSSAKMVNCDNCYSGIIRTQLLHLCR